jgi:hypothetical protein
MDLLKMVLQLSELPTVDKKYFTAKNTFEAFDLNCQQS